MRLTAGTSARGAWYDRNPTTASNATAATVAPVGLTVSFTYTVPSGRKAWAAALAARTYVVTAPAPAGIKYAEVRLTNGVSTSSPVQARLYTGTVGDNVNQSVAVAALLAPADFITAQYFNGDTGGTAYFAMSATITEFDA